MAGWWLGTERFRRWDVSLSSDMWQKVSLDNDFSGLDLDLPDFVSPDCQVGIILVSTPTSITPKTRGSGSVFLVANPTSELQVRVAEKLKITLLAENHHDCQILSFNDAA